ncbi:MAG: zf-TFIIB domain-containing protein [Oligoflexia bacterium]|nr:zf-TFIIB domain-containing protein [Oligoflexia bacterium]
MSSDSWDEMRRAKEEQYFQNQNKEALNRLKARGSGARKSPITGEPMEQLTLHGVVVDRCPSSGGIWLDKGELEEILKASTKEGGAGTSWLQQFMKGLYSK